MATIVIEISSDARDVLARLQALPANMQQGIAKAMDLQNEFTIGHAQQRYLTGPRPDKLGVVTNRLRSSISRAPSRVAGNEVISSIGTNVRYASIHENGFRGNVTVRAHKRRIIAFDRYERRGRGLVKTQSGIKGIIKAHNRAVDIPARPFIGPAIADREPYYGEAISEAILMAWQGGRP